MSYPTRDEEERVRRLVVQETERFLSSLDGPVRNPGADAIPAGERVRGLFRNPVGHKCFPSHISRQQFYPIGKGG